MKEINKIGVLTSGGDAPGMNAAIRSVVRTAYYHEKQIIGISSGYEGMINGEMRPLSKRDVANIIHRGGTILRTSRSEQFRTKNGRTEAYQYCKEFGIDALTVIGGNGTFTGAKYFSEEFDIPVMGIPGTIDNDIYGTDFTIGFDTAINTAVEAVDKIRDTADSHSRMFFIEVMGRHAGFIALYTGIASGASHIFLPEIETDIKHLIEKLNRSMSKKKLFNLVIVAEGNAFGDARKIADEVSNATGTDCKVAIIGHLQRGGAPSGKDRVLASRLGHSAVEALIEGRSGEAVGIVNGQIMYSSFQDAIDKKNILNKDLIQMANILSM